MEELKSVQLIVQMLRNEHIHEDHDAAAVQQTGPDLVANDSWKETSKSYVFLQSCKRTQHTYRQISAYYPWITPKQEREKFDGEQPSERN